MRKSADRMQHCVTADFSKASKTRQTNRMHHSETYFYLIANINANITSAESL